MTTALITGAGGFCAWHLAARLAREDGVRVVGMARGAAPPGTALGTWSECDVRDAAHVEQVVREVRPDWIFHLAGRNAGDPREIHATNVMGTVNVLEAARVNVPHAAVLTVGSAAEYGPGASLPAREEDACRPVGPYGVSKHAATLIALDHARRLGAKVVVARPFNVIGAGIPPTLVVGAVLHRARRALACSGEAVVTVGNIDTARDFVAVEDIVDAYARLLRGAHWGEIFNLCSGEPHSIRDVLERLLAHAPRPVRLVTDPSLMRASDPPSFYGCAEKAQRMIGFKPAGSLDEALAAAWAEAMGGRRQ